MWDLEVPFQLWLLKRSDLKTTSRETAYSNKGATYKLIVDTKSKVSCTEFIFVEEVGHIFDGLVMPCVYA